MKFQKKNQLRKLPKIVSKIKAMLSDAREDIDKKKIDKHKKSIKAVNAQNRKEMEFIKHNQADMPENKISIEIT